MFQYKPDGTERDPDDKAREVVVGWDSEQPSRSLARKLLLLNPVSGLQDAAVDIITKSWGPACATLFKSYWEWVFAIQRQKARILEEEEERQDEIERKLGVGRQEAKGSGTMEGKEKGVMEAEEDEQEDTEQEMAGSKGVADKYGTGASDQSTSGGDGDSQNGSPEESRYTGEVIDEPFTASAMRSPVQPKQGVFAPLLDEAEGHHQTVLGLFALAIVAIEKSSETAGPPPFQKQAPKRKRPNSEAPAVSFKPKKAKSRNSYCSKHT